MILMVEPRQTTITNASNALPNDERVILLTQWLQTLPANFGILSETLSVASADASFRRYFRVKGTAQHPSFIVMDAPPTHEDCQPFIHVAQLFGSSGVNVPKILAQDLAQGFLLLSDLGDTTFLTALNADLSQADELYRQALKALVQLQKASQPDVLPDYDRERLLNEMMLFPQWYLGVHYQYSLTDEQTAALTKVFNALLDNNTAQPQVVMHRDYHSRNLMVCDDGELAVIDFQDMVLGPLSYDLVSLLKDCYVRWPLPLVRELITVGYRAYQQAGLLTNMSEGQFSRCLALTGMQRHLKAAGIFCRLHHRDGKSGYLKDIPRTLYYVLEVAQSEPQLHAFAEWLQLRVLPHFPYQPASEASTCA